MRRSSGGKGGVGGRFTLPLTAEGQKRGAKNGGNKKGLKWWGGGSYGSKMGQ